MAFIEAAVQLLLSYQQPSNVELRKYGIMALTMIGWPLPQTKFCLKAEKAKKANVALGLQNHDRCRRV